MDYTRRDFLKTITAAVISGTGASLFAAAVSTEEEYQIIPENGTVLFQGNSITDAGRDREKQKPNEDLGHGYAFLAAASLRNKLAARHIKFYNRGISGNKVFQLADRWQQDALQVQPDLLSILVGVNDFWHTLAQNYEGTAEIYEQDYRALLKRTQDKLPDVQLVIGEPFAVTEGQSVDEKWFPAFRGYQKAAKVIARDFNAAFIPYQSVFDEAAKEKEVSPQYWTADGVHPTLAGSQLMANAWLETVRRM